MIFKRYLPRSLFVRALLILLLPLVVLQIVLSLSFIQRHFDGVATQMAGGMARELNAVVAAIEDADSGEEARARLYALARLLDTRFALAEGAVIPRDAVRRFYDISGGAVEEALKAGVGRPMTLDLVSSDRFIEAEIQTRRGILLASLDRRRMIPSNPHQLLVVTGIASLLLVGVSLVFLRNQVRPIRQLAEAADAFGRGVSVPFEPRGAEEVRRAGAAFLAMRDRIERHVEQRTRLLSGVSHDLRTPLTRMKLALAMLDGGAEVAELSRDVREMEHMVDSFLAFARGEAGEAATPVDPGALVRGVAEAAAREGCTVDLSIDLPPDLGTVPMREGAMRRALGNLVSNADAVAATIVLGVRSEGDTLHFTVEDDGPGIPESDVERAMLPFVRLDTARNQNRGSGAGLGLSIVADIAHAHGGTLTLGRSTTLGGLRAEIALPR